VRLTGSADELAERCGSTHRRRIRQGVRSGWTLRFLAGESARDAIATVQDLASERAAQRGDPFDAATPASDAWTAGHFEDPWGACTIGAFDGDVLLSAAILGFANGRAFYVTGGSTARGYDEGAAAWMHWRAMNAFRDAGGKWYNLGGVAATAEQADDPSAGLHRFKAGFGAERSTRIGTRWAIAPGHIRSHAAARWIARRATA
jgi:lipid II:glycine glycyltransferase (peptidoglycan interpeptide bridge formation enzyme)